LGGRNAFGKGGKADRAPKKSLDFRPRIRGLAWHVGKGTPGPLLGDAGKKRRKTRFYGGKKKASNFPKKPLGLETIG